MLDNFVHDIYHFRNFISGYQLARALGGGGSGYGSNSHSTQHIYHHYDNPQQNGQMPSISENPQAPQQTLHAPAQNPQTPVPQYSPSFPINPDVPSVPLAPFPSDAPTVISSDCKENCTTEANVAVTPVPEAEFTFANIHPSLFLYAYPVPNKDLEYWAKSVDKKLNLTAPDANNPQSTTTSP